jgi:hypothetical protein
MATLWLLGIAIFGVLNEHYHEHFQELRSYLWTQLGRGAN